MAPNKQQFKLSGKKITPATNRFFGKFNYCVTFVGDRIYHDIKTHDLITLYLRFNAPEPIKEIWVVQRKIYLNDLSFIQGLVDTFSDVIDNIEGPTNEVHQAKIANCRHDEVLRKKYYHDIYDVRLKITEHLTSRQYLFSVHPDWFNQIKTWMSSQGIHLKYTTSTGPLFNRLTLYLKSEEYADIEVFFLIEFSKFEIVDTRVVKI